MPADAATGRLRQRLRRGVVIPAHPLALTQARKLDERRQRGLTRYYLASGAGGVAVGVHTTQFEIHRPRVGLYRPVLEIAAEEVRALGTRKDRQPILVAGIVGRTAQALREAALALELGYDCGLLSLAALRGEPEGKILEHAARVAEAIPLFGFYLQPAVGGRILSYSFWRRFAEIRGVVAIKIAPFDRYRTLDVVRGVVESGREREIALYTGNDDAIILDLLSVFRFTHRGRNASARIAGGLLGQWAVWTRRAVEMLNETQKIRRLPAIPGRWLRRNVELTDANAALFDAAHGFAGCIPGIHEALRRQGLLRGRWCLDPALELSPGQKTEIDRVHRLYPYLRDDAFVARHLDDWLS